MASTVARDDGLSKLTWGSGPGSVLPRPKRPADQKERAEDPRGDGHEEPHRFGVHSRRSPANRFRSRTDLDLVLAARRIPHFVAPPIVREDVIQNRGRDRRGSDAGRAEDDQDGQDPKRSLGYNPDLAAQPPLPRRHLPFRHGSRRYFSIPPIGLPIRSEERRVGKACRYVWCAEQ